MIIEEKKKETFLRNIHFVSNYPHTTIILKRKRLCAFPDLHVGLCSWSTEPSLLVYYGRNLLYTEDISTCFSMNKVIKLKV